MDEEKLYAQVAQEIAINNISPGIYAKALAACGGDEQKARGMYISERVKMLRSERAALLEIEDQTRKNLDRERERRDAEEKEKARRVAIESQKKLPPPDSAKIVIRSTFMPHLMRLCGVLIMFFSVATMGQAFIADESFSIWGRIGSFVFGFVGTCGGYMMVENYSSELAALRKLRQTAKKRRRPWGW